jgi:hypothetical protein
MSKIAALEEMYLIYENLRTQLTEPGAWNDAGMADLNAAFTAFCQREPIGGMFLESVLEELVDRYGARDVAYWITE